MTSGAIYTAMLELFREIKDQNKEEDPMEVSSEILNELNDSIEVQKEKEVKPKNSINFHVNLSITVWNMIKPERQIYQRMLDNEHRNLERSYLVLPKGVWTYCVTKAIARQRKDIPCKWKFKRGKVYPNGKKYITMVGHCVTCNAELNGFLRTKPLSPIKNIKLIFEVENIDYAIHGKTKNQKSVKIHGEATRTLCEKQQTATSITRNLLCESVDLFEVPKERISTPNAIRCSQYRTRQQDQLDDCPIRAIEILKLSFYDKWIRCIGYNPFYTIYANTDHLSLMRCYRWRCKENCTRRQHKVTTNVTLYIHS